MDSAFLEANPNAYELDYLKQFFETMLQDEVEQDDSIAIAEIEGNLAEVWLSLKR